MEDADASATQNSQCEGEELKQCDALFGQIQNEKSRFSIIESRLSIIDLDQDKSGLPAIPGCAFEEGNSANNTIIMFDDVFLKDMNTGSSIKQRQHQQQTACTKESQEFSEGCMRVSTTEANDIFDDEIWNPCANSYQNIAPYQEDVSIEIRENPEEEYFRLVSAPRSSTIYLWLSNSVRLF